MAGFQGRHACVRWTATLLLFVFLFDIPIYIPVPANAREDVCSMLAAGLDACAAEIDLRACRIAQTEIGGILSDVFTAHPEFFFWSGRYTYTVDGDGFLQTVCPFYTMEGEALAAARKELDGELDRMVAPVLPAWSAFEKALYLHDAICLRFAYDDSYRIYDVYGFLREGVGVCQAYTGLYMLLLRRVGIPSVCAASAAMNHIWNLIFLDGAWYHADVTWDDVASGATGVRHTWFLKSDAGMSADGRHYDWQAPVTCTDLWYDKSPALRAAESPLVFCVGNWYYIDNRPAVRGICRMDPETLTWACVYRLDTAWYLAGNPEDSCPEAYAGIGSFGGMLFFNTADSILSYDPADDSLRVLHVPGKRDGLIFGMRIVGSTLTYLIADTPSEAHARRIDLTDADKRLFRRGDNDGDRRVNVRDLTALGWALSDAGYACASAAAADVNADGRVDADDLETLRALILTP